MKHILTLVALLIFGVTAHAQWNRVGDEKSKIMMDFATDHKEWEIIYNGLSKEGLSFISYMEKKATQDVVLRIDYLFDDNSICNETIVCYPSAQLIATLEILNENLVKAGKMQWVNDTGTLKYSIVHDDTIYWLHIAKL